MWKDTAREVVRRKHSTHELLIAVYMLLTAAGACAQTLFLPGSPQVDELAALYRQAGRVFPTTSFPVSKAELSRFANDLRADEAPQQALRMQSYLDKTLMLDEAHDHVSASGMAGLEYTYRTRNLPVDPGLPSELQGVDFRRLFLDQLPLGTLQLDYARDAGIEAGITARVEREYFIDPFHSTNLWENGGSGNPVALENDFISRGFLWYDFHPLQIELGRDMVQVGPGSHSLLPSLDLPYLDMLRVRLPVGRLTGDLIVSTLENRKRGYDVSPVPTEPQFGSTIILMAMHRFEYSFDSLRLGAGALAVYARNGNAYDLGDIFPVFSWHQADIGTNHLSVVLDASWTPFAGLLVQGQFGLQSLNLSDLGGQLGVNLGENQPAPTVGAGIASAQYSVSLGGSMDLLFLAEGGSTHYLWGNFSPDPEGYPDVLARGIDRSYLDGGNVLLPLTSPYGPGATWVELNASLVGLPWLEASISTRYLSRMTDPATGAPVNLVQTAYTRSVAIEQAPHIDTWSIGLKAGALPFGFLRLFIEPTLYIQVDNRVGTTTPWFELSIGASVLGRAATATPGIP